MDSHQSKWQNLRIINNHMKRYSKLHRRLAKVAGVTTGAVRKIWECVKIDLEESGKTEKNSIFYQEVTAEVRNRLDIEENFIVLDKFKKFL